MRARLIFTFLIAGVVSVSAQQPKPSASLTAVATAPPPTAAQAATIAEVLAFERDMEAAVVKGDVKYLATILPDDFRFTHGDGWTSGGEPIRVDTKETWLAAVAKKPYLTRDLGPVAVELHGDIALTYGRYKMRQTSSPNGPETSVWFERVYARRNGRWMYVSHRTVHGPLREEPQKSTSK
jgi:ketosteroid isomerase-like protein